MAYRIVLRQDTASNWAKNNPLLLSGEFGLESDTDKLKLGDGTKKWEDLPYWTPGPTGPAGSSGTSGTSGISGTSGTSGTNGSSGTSGISGTSGTSGVSGATGATGPSGIDGSGTAYYGQVSRITSGTINILVAGTYQSTGLTGTLDSESFGIGLGTADTFAIKNITTESILVKIYGSADIEGGNNKVLGIKLALNGTPIDSTECNAPSGVGTTFAKLITNWMIELAPNDEVALYVTNFSNSGNITLQRARLVASTVGRQGEAGLTGATGPAFSSPYTGNIQINGQSWVTIDANGDTTSTTDVDWDNGNVQTFTLDANPTTFTFSNPNAGATYILIIKQNGAGSYTINWPGTVAWSGGSAPTMTAAADKYDVFTFIYDGSKYFGSYIQNFT